MKSKADELIGLNEKFTKYETVTMKKMKDVELKDAQIEKGKNKSVNVFKHCITSPLPILVVQLSKEAMTIQVSIISEQMVMSVSSLITTNQ